MEFVELKPWEKRSKTAMQLITDANKILHEIVDAQIFVVNLPTIRGLSQFGGVDMYLQARTGQSRAQLAEAQQTLLDAAAKSPVLAGTRPNSLPEAQRPPDPPSDRVQAQALGLSD